MPTIFIVLGFRFMFYSNEHAPIHVHVTKGGASAKFSIAPVQLVENKGMKQAVNILTDSDMNAVERIWLTEEAIWLKTVSGETGCEMFADYPRLKNASHVQRSAYVADEHGIHWPELDEDLCYDGFFQKKQRPYLFSIFMSHPELNASAVARRMGISQSLFAQYIGGIKVPSAERMNAILDEIRSIGKELMEI